MSLKGIGVYCCVLVCCSAGAAADNSRQTGPASGASAPERPLTRSYAVDRKVSEFPASRDLSTPEAAYATIMRDFMATGASDAEWSEISTWRSQGTTRESVASEVAAGYLEARILEVIIYRDRLAAVIAKVKEDNAVGYERRTLFLRDGRWLNVGRDLPAPTMEEARYAFARWCESAYRSGMKEADEAVEPRWNRQPVADPESCLKPYVEFLAEQGREPHAFVMEALAGHELVVMGEVHNRPTYWAFNRDLVRDPAFAESVGTIYMELPSNHQQGIDAFLAGAACRQDLVVQMLRDFMDLGWPCRPTLEFFVAVWEVNQRLPSDKRLRIRLVDMERPWEKIHKREDLREYEVDRNLFMARNILKDRRMSPDKRHGFFIVGMMHAMEEFRCADQKTAWHAAGWHLKQSLGDQLFTIFQHVPVMTNQGETSGRLALGLIDSAFARRQDRPVAFTLREGPFGTLPFDGMPDAGAYGVFRDGYDAYLYLIPLEDERFSPLIDGFYSDEFAREVDRRRRLMYGEPLFSDANAPTGERIARMRAAYWGRPRDWTRAMGPEDAWQRGDGWETAVRQDRHRRATREELTAELDKIYRGIKALDPKKYSMETWEESFDFDYLTMTNWPAMYEWWCNAVREHPLESVEYGQVSRNQDGLPRIQVTTTLQGGIRFSTTFVFEYLPRQQRWKTQFGLDMHLDPQWKDFPGRKEAPSP